MILTMNARRFQRTHPLSEWELHSARVKGYWSGELLTLRLCQIRRLTQGKLQWLAQLALVARKL